MKQTLSPHDFYKHNPNEIPTRPKVNLKKQKKLYQLYKGAQSQQLLPQPIQSKSKPKAQDEQITPLLTQQPESPKGTSTDFFPPGMGSPIQNAAP